ncbi:HtaA domain-containing protein [Streptomyces sp. NPDC059378]|uniref:HtaA domain-containing protein n=1 Tax=Streptomyces sp. NPDC059378 TaxID=3346815 RepID=UPI0036AA7068
MPASIRSRRRPLALAAAVATATTLGAAALALAPTASAAEVPLTGYRLTWGIKESYRSYVTGPWAQGTFTATDGATQAADNGVFTFTDGQGSYDTTTHAVRLAFQGTLTVRSTAHGFTRVLSDLRYDSGTGVLTADLVADGGAEQQDVPLARVAAPTGPAMTDLGTTLTTEAGAFLGSASYANAAGDPLTVTQPGTTQSPSPSVTGSASPSPSTSATESAPVSPPASATGSASASASTSASTGTGPSPSDSATEPAPRGDIADGTLVWGVKESFRTYVVGSVAQGTVTASGGATQAAGNGVLTFPDATGTYDTEAGTLSAAFEGAVNFKGHEDHGTYGLDLTLAGLTATMAGGKGELTADVTSLGETSQDVVLADLTAASADLTPENDVLTLDDVTATLTAAGAKAFGGFYTQGTALDPVDLSVALTDDAELPSGDSGGSGGTGGTGGTAGGSTTGGTTGSVTGGTTGGAAGGSMAATGAGVPVGALGAAGAAAVAAGAGTVYLVRRRRTGA